jgi:hypothetical protein
MGEGQFSVTVCEVTCPLPFLHLAAALPAGAESRAAEASETASRIAVAMRLDMKSSFTFD